MYNATIDTHIRKGLWDRQGVRSFFSARFAARYGERSGCQSMPTRVILKIYVVEKYVFQVLFNLWHLSVVERTSAE